jgi:hypothetical protein
MTAEAEARLKQLLQDAYDRGVAVERQRCAGIVKAARMGERDTDFRSIIYAIENP